MKLRIAFGAFAALAMYLLCAFVAWDFNASNWPSDGRAMCAYLMVTAYVAGFLNPLLDV